MQMETLPSGTILHGRYRVERALGSGGFGHVYLSVDLQTNTQYAIKEYLVSGANGKAQLEHEAQVLSQLHHPNLPAFLSAFDERGHYYVVLGYIEGNDLTDYVRMVRQKNEVIPLARLMGWVLSICDAVAFLHSQRPPIIHRDIKPDNIRIMSNGTAILVDLGNAKTAADGARTLFFIRHQGTPGYAPLEQYPGGTGTDERSDVYALGGTLYFALTAHEPPSVSARNQSIQQKQPDLPSLQERLAQNPPDGQQEQRQFRLGVSKPSKPVPRHSRHLAQLGRLSPELLYRLDAIIQRAMAMKPKDRYPSVKDFSNDLLAVLKVLPTITVPPVVNGRPVDPHSTQPDLPMLYEAMQNAQATNQTPAPQQAPQQAPPPATPSQVILRCSRCGSEFSQPISFCPHCGNPLNTPPQPNQPGPGTSQNKAVHDISEEATMLIPPKMPPQDPLNQAQRPGTPSAQMLQRPEATPAFSSATAARDSQPKTPSVSVPAPQTQMPQRNGPAQARNGARPFIQSVANAHLAQHQMHQEQMPGQPQPTPSRQMSPQTFWAIVAIAAIALLIVLLLLIVFLKGQHHTGLSPWTRFAFSR